MSVAYDLIYLLAALLGWPLLVYRRAVRGAGSLALGERLGNVPSRPVAAQCVWIHGVSLGEINATRTLIAQLRTRHPSLALAISSTTATGIARARELYPRKTVFRFPLDFSWCLARTLNRIRPTLIVLMELEVWPNLIEHAQRRGIPVLIVNGRATEERTLRWMRRWPLRPVARRMFGGLRWVGAQDDLHASRFRELGVPADRVEVTGSLKYDGAEAHAAPDDLHALRAALNISPAAPLWVCGSTGPGEEEQLLRAFRALRGRFPTLQLALIPRKPERFDEVARLIDQSGWTCIRRSRRPDSAAPADSSDSGALAGAAAPQVILGDTLGELRKFYAIADVTFVGRTLVPMGGSDVMEAAVVGRPLVLGPYCENFAEATALLRDCGGAVQVRDEAELALALAGFLDDAARARQAGEAAREAIFSRRGATQRTVDRITSLLDNAAQEAQREP